MRRLQQVPPPRPTQLKPPVPMGVDPSINLRKVNYINRLENIPVTRQRIALQLYPGNKKEFLIFKQKAKKMRKLNR